MLWFAKKAADNLSPKSTPKHPSMVRTALRVAFNPEIGKSIQPIYETNDMFLQLLTIIFVTLNMFPADHPILIGASKQKLTFSLLLTTSWNYMRSSKQAIPQYLIFFGLILSFIFTGVAFVLFCMSAFIPKAHAAGYYTSEAGADIAQSWIDFLFKGGSLAGAGAWPFDTATPIVSAMISALAFYSDAILIVAAVILFYHLAAMTVETAHEGVVMGKRAHQIWAPIRLVVAIGLLVPIGGGLNSGQYIVIKMIEWGSALASNVWEIFLGGFAGSVGAAFAPKLSMDVVYAALLSEACNEAYNRYNKKTAKYDPAADSSSNPNTNGNVTSNDQTQKPNVNNMRKCGGHAWADQTQGGNSNASARQQMAKMCFEQVLLESDIKPYVKQRVNDHVDQSLQGTADQKPLQPYGGEMEDFFNDYMGCLLGAILRPSLDGIFAESAAFGWVSAGALLSGISQAESDAADVSGMIPNVSGPSMGFSQDPNMAQAMEVVRKIGQFVKGLPQGGGGSGSASGFGNFDGCSTTRAQITQAIQKLDIVGNAKDHLLERIFQFIDLIAGWNCVYRSAAAEGEGGLTPANFSIGIQYDTGANPLAEMAHLGHANINAAYDLFDMYVNEMAKVGEKIATKKADNSVVGGELTPLMNLKGDGAQAALTAVGSILTMVIAVFFTSGIMLAFYIPLIPFMQFLFQTLAWVMGALESVIAVPLIALAHLTIEGPGLPGAMAKQAYFFVFNMFLRPVLMVFGLVCGLLVLYVAVSYMNLFYMMAISSVGGAATAHLFLSRLVYSALYVIILYVCANNVFHAIGWLPEHCNKWLGATSMSFMKTGDAREVSGPLLQGAGLLDQKVLSQIQQGGWGAARAFGGGKGLSKK